LVFQVNRENGGTEASRVPPTPSTDPLGFQENKGLQDFKVPKESKVLWDFRVQKEIQVNK
jgi:hypothetical protein